MPYLLMKTSDMYKEVNRVIENGEREYLLISSFGRSSVKGEHTLNYPMFRLFIAVSREKKWKLCAKYDTTFRKYTDTLVDYPSIIQYKMEGINTDGWRKYVRALALHVPRCPLDCWHCLVEECLRHKCEDCPLNRKCDHSRRSSSSPGSLDIRESWFTAGEIVDSFLKQRDYDKKQGLETNVLRATGGEPFLAPGLLLEVLKELRELGLEDHIFVWTETNLVPLIKTDRIKPIIPDESLRELSAYNNFAVHPCFHGLNKRNFEDITGNKIDEYGLLIKAFERLVSAGIDVYPSFASNMSSPEDVEGFYDDISKIHKDLPLRFCLIEDYLYDAIKERMKIDGDSKKFPGRLYDKYEVIDRWEALLYERLGKKYGEEPRHLVRIT